MKYRNTKTGAESNTFSERDWASGTPQRYGWVKIGEEKPVKTLPKDLIDFVFKKKVIEEPEGVITLASDKKEFESVIPKLEDIAAVEVKKFASKAVSDFEKQMGINSPAWKATIEKPNPDPLIQKVAESNLKSIVKKQSKSKSNDNSKQKRPAAKRKS